MAGAEVFKKPVRTLKANNTLEARAFSFAFLYVSKIDKWVVFGGVQFDEALLLAR